MMSATQFQMIQQGILNTCVGMKDIYVFPYTFHLYILISTYMGKKEEKCQCGKILTVTGSR